MNRVESFERTYALQDEIAQTRAQLGETVQALAARADVPARARASAQRTAERLRVLGGRPEPWLMLGAGTVTVLLVLLSRRRWK